MSERKPYPTPLLLIGGGVFVYQVVVVHLWRCCRFIAESRTDTATAVAVAVRCHETLLRDPLHRTARDPTGGAVGDSHSCPGVAAFENHDLRAGRQGLRQGGRSAGAIGSS